MITEKGCKRSETNGSRSSPENRHLIARGDINMIPISWILPRARAMFPDRPAIIDGDVRHSFEQLGRRVDALVSGLKAKGVNQGDRVAILDVNSSIYAEAYYACAQAGMVLVPLNSRLAPPELRYILNDAGAKVLLVSDPFFLAL